MLYLHEFLRKLNFYIIWFSVIFAATLNLSIFVWSSDFLNLIVIKVVILVYYYDHTYSQIHPLSCCASYGIYVICLQSKVNLTDRKKTYHQWFLEKNSHYFKYFVNIFCYLCSIPHIMFEEFLSAKIYSLLQTKS